MEFTEEMIQQVWEKARAMPTNDPTMWRKDECGAWIKRNHYGNSNSQFGWEIDHVPPGGFNDISNLRAVHWQNNPHGVTGGLKCRTTAESECINNIGF